MKTCVRCHEEKTSEEFLYPKSNQKGFKITKSEICKPCRLAKRAYELAYYHNNPERKKAVIKRASGEARNKKLLGRKLVEQAKNVPCSDCGNHYPSYVMDFDHVRGEKLFTISHWSLGSRNLERLAAEIAKCDVVCSNCHRIRTHNRKQGVPDTGAAPVTQT